MGPAERLERNLWVAWRYQRCHQGSVVNRSLFTKEHQESLGFGIGEGRDGREGGEKEGMNKGRKD